MLDLTRYADGSLRLDARVEHLTRVGAVLNVCGFTAENEMRPGVFTRRTILHSTLVPSSMPRKEKNAILRAMCDLVTIEYGTPYRLRSKLK